MSRLTRNVIESVVGQGILVVLGFVATRYINRHLGADVLGLYYLSLAIAAVSSAAVEMGVSTSVVREIANHRDTDGAYVRNLVSTAGSLYWIVFALLASILWLAAPLVLSHWVTLDSLPRATATLALRLFTVSAFLALPRLLYTSVLQGLQRFGTSNAITVLGTLAQQIGTLILLGGTATAEQLAAWYLVSSCLALGAAMVVCARALGPGSLALGLSIQVLRKNARFAGNAMAISFFSALLSRADRFLLSAFLPISDLGHYGVAQAIVQKVLGVVNSIELAGYPALVRAHRDGQLVKQVRSIDDTICLVTLPGFAAVVFGEGPLLTYIFDASVASGLLVPTVMLCLGSFMNATLSAPYRATLAAGRPDLAARLNLHALYVVLPLTVLLVWKLGMLGAGLAWVLYHVFSYSYFVPRYSRVCSGMPPWPFYGRVARILLAGSVIFGGAWVLAASLDASSLFAMTVAYAVASSLWAIVAYRFLATEEFRVALARAVGQVRNRRD